MNKSNEPLFLGSVYEDKGFRAEESLKQTLILKKVMFKTEEIKYGRGKKAIVTHEYVYNTEEDEKVRQRIINTIKHYETILEEVSSENNTQG
jgi:DNA-directed RNA polymerase subunit E'/Rpb7|tara:strand:- start:12211 stop:12486 length:276 start_codon:yes stop_codon:yes gene_type:complete